MDLFEKINRAFGAWYEGLFGGGDDVRPKDILRRILVALEENRKEGFDSKVYVPNQFILEIAVNDEEEKEYLLSFLDREELETAIRRYCQQNHYHIRGALDFTIKEIEPNADERRREKVRVRCRYDSKLAATKPTAKEPGGTAEPQNRREDAESIEIPAARRTPHVLEDENPTVYEMVGDSDMGTVPAVSVARLQVHTPGKAPFEVPVARGAVSIGRSSRAGNDIVLEGDGMVSRRHARVEMDADGRFTVYDLDTTNGTRVNGRKVENRLLNDGDEIHVGATRIVFHQDTPGGSEKEDNGRRTDDASRHTSRAPRLILLDGAQEVDDFVLASETLIGRGATCDITLPDRSVATRHARLVRGDPWTVEALDGETTTRLNGHLLSPGTPTSLHPGDHLEIGSLTLRFEEGRR